jgi:DnaJ-class molecular chaperone
MKEFVNVRCPTCKGKGHVLSGAIALFPPLWIVALFERNDEDGVSREMCGRCEGDGYISIPKKTRW